MVIVGMWLAVIGYGVTYAGMVTLAGRPCSFLEAFQGKCIPIAASSTRTQSATSGPGVTLLGQQQAAQAQQASIIGSTPIPQGASA
jgi:hypothetical protein